jgi:PAB1-binding protein PBP1
LRLPEVLGLRVPTAADDEDGTPTAPLLSTGAAGDWLPFMPKEVMLAGGWRLDVVRFMAEAKAACELPRVKSRYLWAERAGTAGAAPGVPPGAEEATWGGVVPTGVLAGMGEEGEAA